MKFFSFVFMILALIVFTACGGAKTTYKKKATSSLSATGASAIKAPTGMVGTYKSWSPDDSFDDVIIAASGEVTLVKGEGSRKELLGLSTDGSYYISNTGGYPYKINYNQDYSLVIYIPNANGIGSSTYDTYYK